MDKSLPVGIAQLKMDAVVVGPDGKVPPEAIKADTVRQLEELYRQTGDRNYWLAARCLAPIGHTPVIDDTLGLAWMAALVEGGHCSPHHASKWVAHQIGGHSEQATQRRLYRKFAQKPSPKMK